MNLERAKNHTDTLVPVSRFLVWDKNTFNTPTVRRNQPIFASRPRLSWVLPSLQTQTLYITVTNRISFEKWKSHFALASLLRISLLLLMLVATQWITAEKLLCIASFVWLHTFFRTKLMSTNVRSPFMFSVWHPSKIQGVTPGQQCPFEGQCQIAFAIYSINTG